jgi:hypothetical protein
MAPTGATPLGMHTGSPVEQSIVPVRHDAVTQVSPGTHAAQLPAPSHARPSPHRTPAGRSALTVHVDTSPAQATVPVVHGLPVLHNVPAMHSLHSPAPLHTPVDPQPVPGITSSVGTQTGAPEPQSTWPVVHGLPVLHTAPGEHTSHAPVPLHERPAPQVTPRGTSLSGSHTVVISSTQRACPVVHGLPVLQTLPSMHSLHAELPQTPDVPQGAPSIGVSPTQTGAPEAQSTCPVTQGLPVLQTAPAAQTEQLPSAAHVYPPPPQGAPSAKRPVTSQKSAAPQRMTP